MATAIDDSPAGGDARGLTYLWTSILIFAAANSVVRLLTDLGAAYPVEGRNAISFCNLLFVGNLCAFLTLISIYRRSWNRSALKSLDGGDWASLVVLAVLSSALAPALLFLALESTTVTNVLLIGRIEPPLLLLLSIVLMKEKTDRWTVLGTAISTLGVALIVFLQDGGEGAFTFGKGEIYAAIGTVILTVSTIVSKVRLKRIPLGIFTVFRTGLGTVVFFFVVIYLFGSEHFMDVTSPFLWQWMLVYGAIVVVGGQILWFKGIASVSATNVSLASSFTPVAGVLFAVVLLGEHPDMAIIVGGAVIVLGIVVAQLGGVLARRSAAGVRKSTDQAVELEGHVNFKGV